MSLAEKEVPGTPQSLEQLVINIIVKAREPRSVKRGVEQIEEYLRNKIGVHILTADNAGHTKLANKLEEVLNHCIKGVK